MSFADSAHALGDAWREGRCCAAAAPLHGGAKPRSARRSQAGLIDPEQAVVLLADCDALHLVGAVHEEAS